MRNGGYSGRAARERAWLQIMAGELTKVLILAGRLEGHDGRWRLGRLLDLLKRRGCDVQVACLSRGACPVDLPRVVERRSLGNRWLRGFALRGFWSSGILERPDLIHVIDDDMADVALALAETAGVPYFQTVSRFGTIARGIRLSRRWCRGIVATSLDLCEALVGRPGRPGRPDHVDSTGTATM